MNFTDPKLAFDGFLQDLQIDLSFSNHKRKLKLLKIN